MCVEFWDRTREWCWPEKWPSILKSEVLPPSRQTIWPSSPEILYSVSVCLPESR